VEVSVPDPLDFWSAGQLLRAYRTKALSHPVHPVPDRGAFGLQIAGPRFADPLVLRAARAYEAARGPFPRPSLA
jgi:Asp-tRNA(Asn)/Glu-tRNA(Gln) amidotransferase A subunit family amidase